MPDNEPDNTSAEVANAIEQYNMLLPFHSKNKITGNIPLVLKDALQSLPPDSNMKM